MLSDALISFLSCPSLFLSLSLNQKWVSYGSGVKEELWMLI